MLFGRPRVKKLRPISKERFEALCRSGKVVLTFKLHADGRVTDVEIQNNGANEHLAKLCRRAVLDRAPYKPWPEELRLEVEKDYRVITFTFSYD